MGGSFTYKTMGEVIHFDIFLNRVETIQRVQDVLNEKTVFEYDASHRTVNFWLQ